MILILILIHVLLHHVIVITIRISVVAGIIGVGKITGGSNQRTCRWILTIHSHSIVVTIATTDRVCSNTTDIHVTVAIHATIAITVHAWICIIGISLNGSGCISSCRLLWRWIENTGIGICISICISIRI